MWNQCFSSSVGFSSPFLLVWTRIEWIVNNLGTPFNSWADWLFQFMYSPSKFLVIVCIVCVVLIIITFWLHERNEYWHFSWFFCMFTIPAQIAGDSSVPKRICCCCCCCWYENEKKNINKNREKDNELKATLWINVKIVQHHWLHLDPKALCRYIDIFFSFFSILCMMTTVFWTLT